MAEAPIAHKGDLAITKHHTILVVDDEASILRSLARLLGPHYKVLTTTSVQEAFKLLDQHEVHVVMSDQRMPDMHGVEFLSIVREHHPQCVRILFTGYTDTQSAIEAINSGKVYCYISKPWDPDQLRLLIAQAAERYDLYQERKLLMEKLTHSNTQLARRNEELSEANQRLQNLDRLKNVFMEVVSHELNTPTSIIKGYSYLLNRDLGENTSNVVTKALQGITHSTGRLERIAEKIFKVLGSDDPTVRLQLEEVYIPDMLGRLHEDLKPFLKKREQTLSIQCQDDHRGTFDVAKISDALLQLLINAIKFSPNGHTITLKACKVQDELCFKVQDEGIGIPEEDRSALFEPFFASFDSKHHSSGDFEFGKRGIGLGLTIARRFVEMHGGRLTYEPAPTQGSHFLLTLPQPPRVTT